MNTTDVDGSRRTGVPRRYEDQLENEIAENRRLRKLLGEALEALDAIATEPADLNDGYDHYKASRVVAKKTASFIRSQN